MMRRILPPVSFIGALIVSALVATTGTAAAQMCYGPQEIRAAVQSGEVIPLRGAVGQVLTQLGGSIVSVPTLCQEGGRLVYRFTILSAGRTVPVAVDAQTGKASY